MKRKRLRKLVLFVGLMLISLSACGNNEKKSSESANKALLANKQEFNFVVNQEIPTMDMSQVEETVSISAMNAVFEGLYRQAKNGKDLEPAGAESLATKSQDGLNYTFHLRKDAKWSNGDLVTANDYVYAWRRTLEPATAAPYAYLLYAVKNGEAIQKGEKPTSELGIKAIDDYTLEVQLEKPVSYFEWLLVMPMFFPQNQKAVEQYGDKYAATDKQMVYNGPYKMKDFSGPGTDTEWSYVKNPDYWNKKLIKMDKINVNVIKEASTALNIYQDGQADDVTLTGELAKQMFDDPDYTIQKNGRTVFLEMNQMEQFPVFRNKNFRKALTYSIDRKKLVENIIGDGATVSTGLVPASLAYNPKTKADYVKDSGNHLSYDSEKAKEYWKKAQKELGIHNYEFEILAEDTDVFKKISEYLQGTFEENLPGVKVTVASVPASVRLDRGTKGDFDMLLGGWGADYADPSTFLDLFGTGVSYNRGRWSNSEYDQLIDQASGKNALNAEARWQDMLKAEKVLLDDAGIIPLYQRSEGHLRNPKIKGFIAQTSGAQYDFRYLYKLQ